METTIIKIGTPATILYDTDTRAAVVTRVTSDHVWIARVETKNRRRESENLADGELPVMLEDGDVTKPLGDGEMFTLYTDREGEPYATKGDRTIRVRFGHSVTRVDYRA